MNWQTALWHVLNFAAPSFGMGFFASLIAKLLWRVDLSEVPWSRLWLSASAMSALASIVGLIVLGRDGAMLTYLGMAIACGASLWWVGFLRRSR